MELTVVHILSSPQRLNHDYRVVTEKNTTFHEERSNDEKARDIACASRFTTPWGAMMLVVLFWVNLGFGATCIHSIYTS